MLRHSCSAGLAGQRMRTATRRIAPGPPRYAPPGAQAAPSSGLEASRLLRAAGGIAWLIGMRSRPGEPAALHDQVLLADRPALKPALQDLTGARGVACLRRQRRARDVRSHAVMRHAAPRVI